MTRLALVIADEAVGDLVEIWTYVAQDDPARADRFVEEIRAKCETLAENPLIGRVRDELVSGLRSVPIGRYIIFYRRAETSLQVVRVLSGYRDLDALF